MDKYAEIIKLFKLEKPVGYSEEELALAREEAGAMPRELEEFYAVLGASPELRGLQDALILPNKYKALLDREYLIFFNENQGVCQAAVKKSDADDHNDPDPPVYASAGNGEWNLSSPHVSEFLRAMFDYQASICLEFSPEEFYWVTPEEEAKIARLFPKLGSFDNWLYDWNITVYGSGGGRIALMHNGDGDIQMNYAANNERDFGRMSELLDGIGEPI